MAVLLRQTSAVTRESPSVRYSLKGEHILLQSAPRRDGISVGLTKPRGLGSGCGGGGCCCCCCGCGSRGARGMGATFARRPLRVMTSSPDGPACVRWPAAATAAAGAATAGGVTPVAGAPAAREAAPTPPAACVPAAPSSGSGSSAAGARRLLSMLAPERCASGPLAVCHESVTCQQVRSLNAMEIFDNIGW